MCVLFVDKKWLNFNACNVMKIFVKIASTSNLFFNLQNTSIIRRCPLNSYSWWNHLLNSYKEFEFILAIKCKKSATKLVSLNINLGTFGKNMKNSRCPRFKETNFILIWKTFLLIYLWFILNESIKIMLLLNNSCLIKISIMKQNFFSIG